MARRDQGAAAEALQELESSADKLSDWLEKNFRTVAIAVVGVLVVAGIGAWLVNSGKGGEEAASAALAKAREDYLSAMGAGPGAVVVPELANPEAAAQIRAEYEARFSEVASSNPGTVAGTLAALEAAQLAAAGGRDQDALSRAQGAVTAAPRGAVRGMALQRVAQLHEAQGRWAEAAEAHLSASKIRDYPVRGYALADAARAMVQAGNAQAALDLYTEFERDFESLELPAHQKAELLELKASLNR